MLQLYYKEKVEYMKMLLSHYGNESNWGCGTGIASVADESVGSRIHGHASTFYVRILLLLFTNIMD